jgi:hypothetical protein
VGSSWDESEEFYLGNVTVDSGVRPNSVTFYIDGENFGGAQLAEGQREHRLLRRIRSPIE